MNRCLCFPLETGGWIIGIFQIIWAMLDFVFICLHFSLGDTRKDNQNSTDVIENYYEFKTQLLTEVFDGSYSSSSLLLVRDITWCATDLIFASILVHGIYKKRRTLLKMWMIYQAISIVLNICLEIHEYVTTTRVDGVIIDIFFVFSPLLSVYAFLVVHELREQLLRHKPHGYNPGAFENCIVVDSPNTLKRHEF